MRIAERDPVAVEQAEEEAEDDLAVAVAQRLVLAAHRLEALALDVLGHEHAAGAQVGVDARHADERVAAHQPLDAPLVGRLELVVELLGDPLAHLGGQRLASSPGASRLTSGSSSIALRRSVSTASATPGYWTFTATSSPSSVVARWTWPIDAAANARSSKSAKTVSQRPAELLAQQLLELGERDRRDVVAQLGELALELVLLVLGQAVELDHREHLADLHRRAAHPPELVDELAHERRGALALGRRGALGRADAVGGPHARPAQALPGHQAADARRARQPPGRQPAGLGRRLVVVGLRGHPSRVRDPV